MTEEELKEIIIDCDTCHRLFSIDYDKDNVVDMCPFDDKDTYIKWKSFPQCPTLYDVVETIKERINKHEDKN